MKRIYLLLVVGGLFVTESLPAAHAGANGKVDEILSNMQKAASIIKTLQATLKQDVRNLELGGTETYNGEVFFRHAGKNADQVRIDYTKPAGRIVVVNGQQIFLYEKSTNQCFITNRNSLASKNQEFSFFATPYSLSTAEMKARYKIAYLKEEGGTEVLELTPTGESSVRKMKWWVDKGTWLPIKSEMTEKNSEVTTFTLTGTRVNDKSFGAKFEKPCPKGCEEIKR
jgi:outer membrane lipoprotein-sorting protein